MIVYGLHKGDGVIRYIGQTVRTPQRRLSVHKADARFGKQNPVQDWMRKHGVEGIELIVLETAEDREHLDALERFWIAQMRESGIKQMNVTAGGRGHAGYRYGPETIAKRVAKLTGQQRTPEQRERISAGKTGRVQSPAQLAHLAKMRTIRNTK